jgi:hypothetical protein
VKFEQGSETQPHQVFKISVGQKDSDEFVENVSNSIYIVSLVCPSISFNNNNNNSIHPGLTVIISVDRFETIKPVIKTALVWQTSNSHRNETHTHTACELLTDFSDVFEHIENGLSKTDVSILGVRLVPFGEHVQ